MRHAIFTRMMAVALCAVLLASFALLWAFYSTVSGELTASLAREARNVALGLDGVSDKNAYLNALSGARVTWIAEDGEVLFDSAADEGKMANHLDRPEVKAALTTGAGSESRLSATLSKSTHYYAVRLSDGSIVRLSQTQDSVLGILYSMLSMFALLFAAIAALCAVAAGRAARALVKPVNELNLEEPAANNVYDELAPLLSRLARQGAHIRAQMEELETRRKEFTAVADNMAEGLVLLNAQLRVLAVNRSALTLFGVPESIGAHLLYYSRDLNINALAEKAASGAAAEKVIELDGRYFQVMANPVAGGGAVLLMPDVTQRYQAERMRREFSANVSHELKTPLTAIAGYAELIASGLAKPEDAQGFAGRVMDEAARLLALIDDIMRLSKLDEGAGSEMQPVRLAEIAHTAVERLHAIADKRNITLNLETDDSVVNGTPEMLGELAFNLIDNAIKYNVEGGRVDVIVKDRAFIVRDTGIGIPHGEEEKIFERFYRVEKSRSREVGGTGLGLAIVKHAARFHQAKIELKSEVGVGTEIQVIF